MTNSTPWLIWALLSAIFAALIGLSLSTLFLRRPLADMTAALGERRSRKVTDEDVEDAAAQDVASTHPTD